MNNDACRRETSEAKMMDTEFAHCTKCAHCCISLTENGQFCVPLTKEDAHRIRKNSIYQDFKGKNIINIVKGISDPYYPYDMVANGLCPFLDTAIMQCKIYPDRPSNCASFTCYD